MPHSWNVSFSFPQLNGGLLNLGQRNASAATFRDRESTLNDTTHVQRQDNRIDLDGRGLLFPVIIQVGPPSSHRLLDKSIPRSASPPSITFHNQQTQLSPNVFRE